MSATSLSLSSHFQEKRIYDLKKKNQELEKFKFVLDYKIKELKKQIEPKENEIKVMKEQIQEVREGCGSHSLPLRTSLPSNPVVHWPRGNEKECFTQPRHPRLPAPQSKLDGCVGVESQGSLIALANGRCSC